MRESEDPDSPDRPNHLPGGPRGSGAPQARVWLQVLAFAAIYLIWGSTYLGIRIAVKTLPPFLMAAARFLLAGSVLYTFLRARGVERPRRAEWGRAALAGFLMHALGNGLVTWAEQRVPSNLAALMITGVPLFTALFDWLRPGGARPASRVLVGIGLGAAGMTLLVANRTSLAATADGQGATVLGVAALLLSGLTWAAGSLYSRYGSMHRHPIMAAAQQMLTGGAVLLVISLARGEPGGLSTSALTATSVGAFFYLTLFGSLIAFSAFGWLVKVSTPVRVSTTAYVNPVVAVILGWLVLGETLSPRALVGACLIVCAVIVMSVRTPKSWRRSPPVGVATVKPIA